MLASRVARRGTGWVSLHASEPDRDGAQTVSEECIQALCRVCRAEDQLSDLVACVRAIESMYLEWRRQTRAGMKRLMLSSVPLYERTRISGLRAQHHSGLFQTADYSAAMLSYFIDFRAPNDLEAAIEARMERQRVITPAIGGFWSSSKSRRHPGAWAIPTPWRPARPCAGGHVVAARQRWHHPGCGLPRTVFASVGFWMYDDSLVAVETPTASIEVTQPREVRMYGRDVRAVAGDGRCTASPHESWWAGRSAGFAPNSKAGRLHVVREPPAPPVTRVECRAATPRRPLPNGHTRDLILVLPPLIQSLCQWMHRHTLVKFLCILYN